MSIINVPPTKTKQLEMKRDLEMATEGYSLLEQKREILVMELMHLMDKVKTVQQEVDERREKAYATLKRAMSFNGYHTMKNIAEGIQYDHKVKASVRVAAGVKIPMLEIEHGDFRSQYGFVGTDSLVDQTMTDYLSLMQAIGHLAELESSVWLLARELKKTQRHVNALEHIFIPNYKDTLRFIEQALEGKELDSFFTMKTIKKRMEKAAEENERNQGN